MAAKIILRSLEAVLFTNPYTIENKLGFASEFVKRSSKIFSHDPNIVTAPQNAPAQVPRVEIRSPDQSYIAQFANNRISLKYQDMHNLRAPLGVQFPMFLDSLTHATQSTMEFLNPRVLRLGFVIGFLADLGSSSNKYLSEEFFQNNPCSDAHEINLGILYKLSLESFSANRWVRYQTLRAQNDPSIDYAMAIDIDINTLAEVMNNYSTSEIITFYKLAYEHVNTSLRQFPLLNLLQQE